MRDRRAVLIVPAGFPLSKFCHLGLHIRTQYYPHDRVPVYQAERVQCSPPSVRSVQGCSVASERIAYCHSEELQHLRTTCDLRCVTRQCHLDERRAPRADTTAWGTQRSSGNVAVDKSGALLADAFFALAYRQACVYTTWV